MGMGKETDETAQSDPGSWLTICLGMGWDETGWCRAGMAPAPDGTRAGTGRGGVAPAADLHGVAGEQQPRGAPGQQQQRLRLHRLHPVMWAAG